jgi:gamma-glutamyltranspeptidase/glutathione hydrolase
VASGSPSGTSAAVDIALAGGNAVDACVAASVMAWVAEPLFSSLGGSAFVTVAAPDGTVEVIDGNSAMPHTPPPQPGAGVTRVHLPYSDGVETGIGGGSVAVPGVLAALHRAWRRHGTAPWDEVLAPAIAAARKGIAVPPTSAYYLSVTWRALWSRYAEAAALLGRDGVPLVEGELLRQPALAEVLEEVARHGPRVFYEGEVAADIAASARRDGGFLQKSDLSSYEAEVRPPLMIRAFGSEVFTNPPPATGGAVLAHLLTQMESSLPALGSDDDKTRLQAFVGALGAAYAYRRQRYQDPSGIAAAYAEAVGRLKGPASTTHASAADTGGYACAITASAGYGSGLVVRGIVLNNTLGEEELNPLGIHSLPPGARCHSNMAPTIVRSEGRTVALGSPGADRIVSAIAQALLRITVDDADLAAAVSSPRAHLDRRAEGEVLCYEPGLPGDAIEGYPARPFEDKHMFFGAVQAAELRPDGRVAAAHDPRRSGASAIV